MSMQYGGSGSRKRKRSGPSVPKYKQRRVGPAPAFVRAVPRVYVSRTPGGQITADNHYFDTERTATTVASSTANWTNTEYDPNTTAMLCLFAPVTGDDITNRTGRKVFVKKIRIHGAFQCLPQSVQASGDVGEAIRVIVYQDKQTNAAQSQGEDLIASGAGSDALHMHQNLANLGRFKVWYDKIINIDVPQMTGAAAAIETAGVIRHFKISIKPNCWVNYNATNGGTVADVVDNSFHVIMNTQSTNLAATVAYKVRTVFTP